MTSVQPDIEKLLSEMRKRNTTNPRALRELKLRAAPIAAHLDKSKDAAQQKELLGIFAAMADQFNDAASGQSDNISSRMDPKVYIKRKYLIMSTDEKLNQFQAPPEDRSEVMRKATIDDANGLGIELNGLTTAGDGLLIAISEPIRPISASVRPTKPQEKSDLPQFSTDPEEMTSRIAKIAPISIPDARGADSTRWMEPPRSPSPEAEQRMLKYKQWCPSTKTPFSQGSGSKISYQPLPTINKEEGQKWLSQTKAAHVQLDKKLTEVINGDRTPSLWVPISEMCFEDGAVMSPNISLDQTFGELADVVLNNDDDAVLPDFWSKKIDHDRNRVTHSGVTWEWQDPSTRVLDVFMKKKKDGQKESLGIEKVAKEGEYVVALVQKDKKEGPMPVDIPRSHRQSASKHFQKVVFPDDDVSKVLELQSGEDASEKVFDRRSFSPFTNPVFIEVCTGSPEGEVEKGALGMDTGLSAVPINPTTIVRGSPGVKGKQRMAGSKMTGDTMPGMAEILVATGK